MSPGNLLALFALDGKVAVVTGASGQLGSAFLATLRAMGAHTVGVDLQRGDEVVEADVTDQSSVASLFARIADDLGRVDVLVNNAGIGVYTPFEQRSVEELARVAAVNLTGTALCTRAAAELMPSGGSIVNIGSIYGVVSPDPRIYGESGRNSSEIYGATKAGVIQMTKWFAVHLAPRQIRVNCISPGGIFAEQTPDFVTEYERRTPLGRMATVGDLQGAIVYLASGASDYVTGLNLVVDGGWSAW